MGLPRIEDVITFDKRIEAKAKALRDKLDHGTDPSEAEEVNATLNDLLQSRELARSILKRLIGRGA